MARVARETPPGSGGWVVTGDPDPKHPRQAPQFACSACGRGIGKTAPLYLLRGGHVVCGRCTHSQAEHTRFYPDCPEDWHDLMEHASEFPTRAAAAVILGIASARDTGKRRRQSDCICGHEALLCRCGHPAGRHVIAESGTWVCPVHGRMERCQVCECAKFRHAEPEDPRDYGLTADDLRDAAARLYRPDDPRLAVINWTHVTAARYELIRSCLCGLADAIEGSHHD
jgi:hypothetical protein